MWLLIHIELASCCVLHLMVQPSFGIFCHTMPLMAGIRRN
ncbi:hypothetical protein SynROS8604_03017 [Synechococcus sp. ROS8604]|nr:hypothetical protein SynROS8604_03017 [Synechococcus sp. ROS8604]